MHGKAENELAPRLLLKVASSRHLSIGVQVLWTVLGYAWDQLRICCFDSLTGKRQHGGRGSPIKLLCVGAAASSACPAKDHDFETGDAGAAHTYPQQAHLFTETAREHDEHPSV